MPSSIIYVNPGHGNEPYILGGLIAQGVANHIETTTGQRPKIVMPLLYGDRQKAILKEWGVKGVRLDTSLGGMYHQLVFADNNFSRHLKTTLIQQPSIQQATRRYLEKKYDNISLEINIASRISSGQRAVFAFPCLISELMEKTLGERVLAAQFDQEQLEQFYRTMQEVERNFCLAFIPAYHTFSYDSNRTSKPNEVATPPLKPLSEPNNDPLPRNSVYCMFSGTGSEVAELEKRAQKLQQEGNHIIVQPWANTTQFDKRDTCVISNKNIKKVLGRAGWGTIWQCQQAGAEFEALPYSVGDDPEMYFNVRTLAEVPMLAATQRQRELFTSMDGITFVVQRII